MASSPTTADFTRLDEQLEGRVLTSTDPAWDVTRSVFNLTVDQRAAAIALAATDEDVATVIDFARANGLRVAAQGTGHNAGPLGWEQETIVLRTTALRGVTIDPDARRATVRAGNRWGDVVGPAAEHGLAALHGSSPTVGVVGYSLGGGMGWYARRHGLQAHHVVSAEVVTAGGRKLCVSPDREPDLFWALRGGGGNLAVVTRLEFALLPIPEVYAGIMFFPAERASEVFHAWREWLPGAPDEITSIGRLLQLPPDPEVPEPLRGRSFVMVEAAFLGPEVDGRDLVRPLRDLGPEIDTFATTGPAALSELHMDPVDPMPAYSGAGLFEALPEAGIEALLEVTGPASNTPLVSVELRHTGGALARPADAALASLPGSLALFAVGPVATPEDAAAVGERLEGLDRALAPYKAGEYLNLTEYEVDPSDAYEAGALARLRQLRREWDPSGLLSANHPLLA